MKRTKLYVLAIALTVVPVSASALPWSWDMFSQPSHRAQEDEAPLMPQSTVPFMAKPLQIKDREGAAKILNTVPANKESIEIGKIMYEAYCATCHGKIGLGDGIVGQKYVPPTDLTGDYVQQKPDGDIFYTITYGGLFIMPSYRDAIPPENRWHIINYIKHRLKTGK